MLHINTRRHPFASDLLDGLDLAANGWREFSLSYDPQGGAELFRNMFGEPRSVGVAVAKISSTLVKKLQKSGSLKPYEVSTRKIFSKLSRSRAKYVVVYDVGQGLAQGLTNSKGIPHTYVDLGGGVTTDAGTWPKKMTGFCFCNKPAVILSHWHYDHFSSANRFSAHHLNWIAPNQPLGAGPQASFAAAVITHGSLSIWPPKVAKAKSRAGLTIEQCTGKVQNTSGLAVFLDDPIGKREPIVLTGDAGYTHIPGLKACKPFSMVVPHHGGIASGLAVTDPGFRNSRVVISCGPSNSYGHPLPASKLKLTSAHWTLGPTGARVDDRYTEDLRPALGHVGMRWSGPVPAVRACPRCASTTVPARSQW